MPQDPEQLPSSAKSESSAEPPSPPPGVFVEVVTGPSGKQVRIQNTGGLDELATLTVLGSAYREVQRRLDLPR